ncbi:hypothetical protein H6761_02880 [Candidatus Nomurabacteria bacterium]|nr:hypothetical protein [Candidatus Nomurabacteria bacterium]
MNLEELLQFINNEDQRLIQFKNGNNEKERILSRTVKMTEELGELCNEVLSFIGDQRKEKLERTDKDNLPNEFADVIITTLLLAKTMNVDIVKALEDKIEKIKKRNY